MKKILVTGGAGFVGRHLAAELLRRELEVNILDDLSNSSKDNIVSGAVFFEGDIRDKEKVKEAINGCDTVIHLAAMISLQESIKDPAKCFSINIEGTANIVKESLNSNNIRLIFASSCAVYPLHPKEALKEEMATNGDTPYAFSKRAGEHIIDIYKKLEGLNACSLRFFNIYGPGQNPESIYAAVIPKFISNVKNTEPLQIYGEGTQKRDFIHIKDIIKAIILAAESNFSGILNAGTGKSTSVRDLAALIIEIFGKGNSENIEAIPGDASFSCADISKIKDNLNFNPSVSINNGLSELINSQE